MERKQFTFKEDYYKALVRIKNDADRAKAYDSIIEFALYEKEANYENLPDSASICFLLVKSDIAKGIKRAKSGKNGGLLSKNDKQTAKNDKKTKANDKQNKNEDTYISNILLNNNISSISDNDLSQSKEKEDVQEKGVKGGKTKFTPPVFDEVWNYIHDMEWEMLVDPEAFMAYYDSIGWTVGKKSMKNWKAAVRTWMISEKKKRGVTDHGTTDGHSIQKELYAGDITADMD